MPPTLRCPLCRSAQADTSVVGADGRVLWHCTGCWLLFADSATHLSEEAARVRYESHNNSIEVQGYVDFLRRAVAPALPFIQPGWRGLDFGSGPGPTLSRLLAREGIVCADYDPIFGPALDCTQRYDFVFATESFEHFTDPAAELTLIDQLLNPGGVFVLMTERWDSLQGIPAWYYTRDPTHVVFCHDKTIEWIEARYGFSRLFDDGKRVVGWGKTNTLG